jgi:hypothetical protein
MKYLAVLKELTFGELASIAILVFATLAIGYGLIA